MTVEERPIDPPRTFAQWREALRPDGHGMTRGLAEALRAGRVPENTGAAILERMRRYCENELNRQTCRLGDLLEQYGGDTETVSLLCVRYSRTCTMLLRITEVDGIPRDSAMRLAAEMRSYAIRVLGSIARGTTPPNEDIEYCVRRLERRWDAE